MRKRVERLYRAEAAGALVSYREASAPDVRLFGFVVGVGASFALLHTLNPDVMALNGYDAVPLAEMRKVRLLDEDDLLPRAAALDGIAPVPQPDVLLLDFPGLLSSAGAHFPLLTLHTERRWPGRCYIGRVARLTGRGVVLRGIDPQARWHDSDYAYPYDAITRVGFGDGYADALHRVARADRRAARDSDED